MRELLIAVIIAASVGCQGLLDHWRSEYASPGTEIKTPKLEPASIEAAKRVDKVSRQLMAGSPKLGLEIMFQTVKLPDPEILHPNHSSIFITEPLVLACKTDEELAAVLASEIGLMIAEQRRQERMSLPQPIPREGTFNKPDGSTDFDPGRDLELAYYEKYHRKPAEKALMPASDPKTVARELLKDAQIDPKLYDDVSPLVRGAKRNHAMAKQFDSRSESPRWSN